MHCASVFFVVFFSFFPFFFSPFRFFCSSYCFFLLFLSLFVILNSFSTRTLPNTPKQHQNQPQPSKTESSQTKADLCLFSFSFLFFSSFFCGGVKSDSHLHTLTRHSSLFASWSRCGIYHFPLLTHPPPTTHNTHTHTQPRTHLFALAYEWERLIAVLQKRNTKTTLSTTKQLKCPHQNAKNT